MTTLTQYKCRECHWVWATWLSRCPRCHTRDLEATMPKISKAAGASVAPPRGEVASSPGTSSEASGKTQPTNLPKSESEFQKPVPTTEPLSNQDPTEPLDSVDSTGGSTPETGMAPLPEIPKRNASKAEWVEFAEAVGFEGAADLTRDELVAWWDAEMAKG